MKSDGYAIVLVKLIVELMSNHEGEKVNKSSNNISRAYEIVEGEYIVPVGQLVWKPDYGRQNCSHLEGILISLVNLRFFRAFLEREDAKHKRQ